MIFSWSSNVTHTFQGNLYPLYVQFYAPFQEAHSLKQRRNDVNATSSHWRRYDFVSTPFVCWVKAKGPVAQSVTCLATDACLTADSGVASTIPARYHILGQKRNAAYKTYIVYGGYFTNLSQTICHSLSADSCIMSSWGCSGYHCHRTKLIQQFKPTFLSILTSLH